MSRKKLSPGIQTVNIKKSGGGTRKQKVQVLKSGKWKFLKNTSSSPSKRSASKGKKKKGNPSRKVSKTGKSKMLRTIGLTGGVEDIAWGFIGFSLLGKNVTALPMTRVIQGLAGHALDRRGKARLVSGILDLVTLWLAGGFGNGFSSFGGGGADIRNQLAKLSFL